MCTGWYQRQIEIFNWASHLASLSFSLFYCPCPHFLISTKFSQADQIQFLHYAKKLTVPGPLCFLILWLNLLLADSLITAEKSLPSVVDSVSGLRSESSPFLPEVVALATKPENIWYFSQGVFYISRLFQSSQFKAEVLLQ